MLGPSVPVPVIPLEEEVARRSVPLEADNNNELVQLDAKASHQAPEKTRSQNSSNRDGTRKTKEMQESKGKEEGATVKKLSSASKEPVLNIILPPNPYTNEEMQSYYEWQCQAETRRRALIGMNFYKEGKTASADIKNQKRPVKKFPATNNTATFQEQPLSPASSGQSWMPSGSVRMGALLVFFLVLAIVGGRAGFLSNASGDREG